MQTTIKVKGIEEKVAKNGKPFWCVSTDSIGKINLWSEQKPIVDKMRDAWKDDERVELEVEQKGKYLNVISLVATGKVPVEKATATSSPKVEEPLAEVSIVMDNPEVYTRLCCEVFNSLSWDTEKDNPLDTMNLAIKLVEHARKAF